MEIESCPDCGGSCPCCGWESQPPGMEWISVKDRLPEVSEDILAWGPEGDVELGFLSQVDIDNGHPENGGWCDFYFTVTHWMPLPEPPPDLKSSPPDIRGMSEEEPPKA